MLDEDRIVRVARALCVLDGLDPETEITVGADVVEEGGGERYHEVTAPAWTTYADEARRMIAAVRAMVLVG
ncbi:MAG: hypothetical protein ACRYGP_10620 [Janthinobacterium lividum]